MLLKYFYDEKLAQAAYMVGCQATGEAVMVDPARDVEPYIEAAKKEGLTLVGSLETHIHADFVAGSRELAKRLRATMYVSNEGGKDWTYQNIEQFPHQLLSDGDKFKIGNLTFSVMHTPGHTPESISFLLKDVNADEPMGMFTGDFVFVGDIGRPDLLEKAAGMKGTSEAGAYEMFKSLERFKSLPDFIQIWPAHGAGSACGKALGAVPSSTVGYEKRFNWALQYDNQEAFVQDLQEGQPEPPSYFAVMKHVNKVGPNIVAELPAPRRIDTLKELQEAVQSGAQVIDTRDSALFAKQHIKGTYNIPFGKSFTNWAGWIVDYDRSLYLLAAPKDLEDIQTALRSIGIDRTEYYMDVDLAIQSASEVEAYHDITPGEAAPLVANGEVNVVDVRNLSEWQDGHIDGAEHIMLGTLLDRIDEVPTDRPLLVHCASGVRSAIGVSLLQAKGIKDVRNVMGGYNRWQQEVQSQTV